MLSVKKLGIGSVPLIIAIGGGLGISQYTSNFFNGTPKDVDVVVQNTLQTFGNDPLMGVEGINEDESLVAQPLFTMNLPEQFGGIKGGYEYLVSEDSETHEYCLLLKQSDGIESKKGYVYSSASGAVTSSFDGCPSDEFTPLKEEKSSSNTAAVIYEKGSAFALSSLASAPFFVWFWDSMKLKTPPRAKTLPTPKRSRRMLEEKVEQVIREWSEYELDPIKVLDYPMILNMGFEPTAKFHLVMRKVKAAVKNKIAEDLLEDLVIEFEHSYEVMISEAQRMKWNSFSVEEKKHLRTAQKLLNMAMDSSSSSSERNVAYKQLLKEVEGIISLSPATILEIEERSMLGIEA